MSCAYLLPTEFKQKYPMSKIKLGHGIDGTVYKCGDYAIKVLESGNSDGALTFFKELNYYTLLNHPCILKPIAWTLDNFGYLLLPLGIKLIDAYNTNLITADQIISDTLSALTYMLSLGVNHCDLHDENMIYHEGRVKIIDMGFASPYEIGLDICTLLRAYCKLGILQKEKVDYQYLIDKVKTHYQTVYEKDHPFIRQIMKLGTMPGTIPGKIPESTFMYNLTNISNDLIPIVKHILSPEISSMKDKYKLTNQTITLMMRIIDRCKNINMKLLTYMALKIAGFICMDIFTNLESTKCFIEDMNDNITFKDCYQMIFDIMQVCECKLLIV